LAAARRFAAEAPELRDRLEGLDRLEERERVELERLELERLELERLELDLLEALARPRELRDDLRAPDRLPPPDLLPPLPRDELLPWAMSPSLPTSAAAARPDYRY
jgi:hypothetical protein